MSDEPTVARAPGTDPAPPLADLLPMRKAAPFPRAAALAAALVAILLAIAAVVATAIYLSSEPDSALGGGSGGGGLDGLAGADAGPPLDPLEIPPVEPVHYLEVPRERAFLINEGVPFSKAPNPAAAPFRATLSADDLRRATDCLAAAGYYEAGDDIRGQQAVAQVILNRLRHPAFPHTVCGVVFQGSERRTGCQFSFTCDGAMARRQPSAAAWQRAKGVALAALGGFVFVPVGWATHYHTDWVVPNWSANVDKIARVDTHLFFRWNGGAGQPRAFRSPHAAPEPEIAQLGGLATPGGDAMDPGNTLAADAGLLTGDVFAAGGGAPAVRDAPDVPAAILRGNILVSVDDGGTAFVVRSDPSRLGGEIALVALDLCRIRDRAACRVQAYAGAPGGAPDFRYERDRARGVESALWNCALVKRPAVAQCLPGTAGANP